MSGIGMIGIIYFIVILLANSVGAVSGMGGGVIIKPLFDFIGYHSVAAISFYSTVAVLTMSVVSTLKQLKNGIKIDFKKAILISVGAMVGGYLGNLVFELLLSSFSSEKFVTLVQIIITVLTLIFAYVYNQHEFMKLKLTSVFSFIGCGLILGFLASLLGIGGGPINVSLLMLMFSMPIKDATVYSIVIIFFSQLTKVVTIASTTGFARFDLNVLWFVIPAAIIGGFLGAVLSKVLSSEKVSLVFRWIILFVVLINVYNGIQLFL